MDMKPILKNKWLLLLGLVGVLFIFIGPVLSRISGAMNQRTPVTANTSASAAGKGENPDNPVATYQSTYDTQLTKMLSNIQGINKVSVMVTLDSSGGVEVANNTRTSTQTQTTGNSGQSTSSTSDTEVFTETNSDGEKVPYVVNQVTPQVRGVLVTVNANDFYVAKSEIIDAITNVLDVPAYKISVEPQKTSS